jgi:hypothetical protein
MKKKPSHDEVLVRYLLGEVTEEEQIRLEERFFTDEESYQELVALEDELKYEYAQGGLTRQQRQSFEKRFLVTNADREKVALAGAVLQQANQVRAEAEAALARPTEAASWWRSLASLLTLSSPGMRLAFNCAGILVLAGFAWFTYQTARLRSQVADLRALQKSEERNARQQLADGNVRQEKLSRRLAQDQEHLRELEKQLANRQPFPGSLGFILSPGLVRDAEGPKRLVVPADAGPVHFQLDVKNKTRFNSYRVELQTLDGDQIWSQKVPQPEFEISARLLPAGDYVIALKGTTPGGETEDAGEFYFVVVRR